MQYYVQTNADGVKTYGQGSPPAGADLLDEATFRTRLYGASSWDWRKPEVVALGASLGLTANDVKAANQAKG